MEARDAEYWIAHLGLTFHPEGGYFKESYRSALQMDLSGSDDRYVGERNASTAIYFLVTADRPSRLHRLKTDEIWHFYAGDTLEIWCIDPQGSLRMLLLGADGTQGSQFQLLVPADTWFGARVRAGGTYTLCGCTMAPGFDFADFELGERAALLAAYPECAAIIHSLT